MAFKLKFFLSVFFLSLIINPAFAETQKADSQSDQQIDDFSLSGYGDKGKKAWDLAGKSADIFTDVVKLKSVLGNLYDEKEKIKLTADKGDFNKTSGLVHLEDNVIVTTSSGAKLTSDSLDWDRKQQLLSTVSRINLQKDELNLQGIGASTKPDLKKIQLEKDVRLDIAQQNKNKTKSEKIVITCRGPLDIDYDKNIAVFNNEVKVERPDAVIYSDKMEVYFNADKAKAKTDSASLVTAGSIERIVALGNVRITQGENISYSDKAVYTALNKKVTLTGRPQLVIYQTEQMNAAFGN